MADEAFALSPIHARASLPTDADYDAIHEAFMETSRGRWFLSEYAKRNRNADTRMVIEAVERIEASLASQKQAQAEPEATPEVDLWPELAKAFTKTRIEIAQRLMCKRNEQAFEAIRSSVETIRSVSWALRERGFDARICDMFDAQVNAITDGYTGLLTDNSVAGDTEAEVLAAFDALIQHVEALTGGEGMQTDALDVIVDAVADAMSDDDDAAVLPEDEPVEFAAPEEVAVVEPVAPETAAYPDAAFHEIYGDDSDIEIVDAVPADNQPLPAAPTEPEMNRQRLYEAKLAPYHAPSTTSESISAADDIEIVDVASEAAGCASPSDLIGERSLSRLEETKPLEPLKVEPASPIQTSLGQVLIANGVIHNPALTRPDPLAPFRRMSQAEKVAFFT